MNINTGPFIKVACFCDNVIEGKDNVFSLIRIVDVINLHAQGADVPDEMPPLPYRLKIVIIMAAGMARGRHNLRVVPENPMGLHDSEDARTVTIHLEEGRTMNLVADFGYVFDHEGTYLFHVMLDDEHLTSMPLTIRYNRIVTSS